jgi:HTH-type transcriptional regulator/antitoxin MqsA
MPGWYCTCGEGVHTGKDMRESDRQLNLLKAKADNVLLPNDVRRIRKKLRLTQEIAGQVIGGGPNAFNKYEKGIVLPSQAVSNLLRVLDAKPDVLSILTQSQN